MLTFTEPALAYVNTKTTPLEIHFIYLDKKEIYCIFKTCRIICILFSTKFCLFHNFIFFCLIIFMLFINHMLKFKYHPHPVIAYLRDNSWRCTQSMQLYSPNMYLKPIQKHVCSVGSHFYSLLSNPHPYFPCWWFLYCTVLNASVPL